MIKKHQLYSYFKSNNLFAGKILEDLGNNVKIDRSWLLQAGRKDSQYNICPKSRLDICETPPSEEHLDKIITKFTENIKEHQKC